MTWEEIKAIPEGARVRVTVEGEVRRHQGCNVLEVTLDNADGGSTWFLPSELTAPTTKIEVLAAPVDPDVLAVREILAAGMSTGTTDWAGRYLAGDWDNVPRFQAALAAYRSVKG